MNPIILVLIMVMAVFLLLFMLVVISGVKRYNGQKRADAIEKRRNAQRIRRERRQVSLDGARDASGFELGNSLVIAGMREKYYDMMETLDVPPDAPKIWRGADILRLKDYDLLHYFWDNGKELRIFPTWEGIEGALAYSGAGSGLKESEIGFDLVAVPKAAIEQWVQLPGGDVRFVYRLKKSGKLEKMRLDGSALPVFMSMPERERGYVMKHVYPRSREQIRVVKTEYRKLKRALRKGEITRGEFETLKNKLVLKI